VEATKQTGGLSAGALGRSLFPALALTAAGLFAYHGLVGYAPYAGFETVPDETEAFFFASSGSSPLLIAVLTAWLLFNRRDRIREAVGQPTSALLAGLTIATAIGFHLWGTYVGATDLLVVSLIFMLLGSGALLGGFAGMRAVWVPAVFMLLLLPAPAELINHIMFPLQLVTAKISVSVLSLLGVPALQLGDQIHTMSRIFQVIEACSGLRAIETLTMTGIIYAEVSYRGRLQVTLIVIAGPLIGFLINQLRVLSLILNPYSEFAAVHTAQGIVMVVGGVLLLAAFDWVLGRVLPPDAPAQLSPKVSTQPKGNPLLRLAILCVVLGMLGIAGLSISGWQKNEPFPNPLFNFPAQIDGWRVTAGLPLDDEFLGSVRFTEWMHRRYEHGDERVEAFVGADRRLRRRVSLISEKTSLPGSGWTVVQRRLVELEPDGLIVEELELLSRAERRLVYHWREGTAPVFVETLRSTLGLDQSPMRRPGRALVFRVSTPLVDESSRAGAQQILGEFSQKLRNFYESK
jgi:exosortase